MGNIFHADNWELMPRFHRANFFNSITGFKSANLIGTQSQTGLLNLAVFNSVVHIGANPPFMGFIMRPHTVERHTLENILQTDCFTINHIGKSFYEKAHQTSAKYDRDVSEFDAVGLQPYFSENLPAPYVGESVVKIGLRYREQHEIECNNTLLVIGEIVEVILEDINMLEPDGYVNLEKAGTVAISALDGYHTTSLLDRLPYAQVNEKKSE